MNQTLLSNILTVLITCASAVAIFHRLFDYLKDRSQKINELKLGLAKEVSVGLSKVMELERIDKEIRNDFEEYKEDCKQSSEHVNARIMDLERNYNTLIQRIFDILKK